MRKIEEIKAEMRKVLTIKRNAERKRARCVERISKLKAELKAAGGSANEKTIHKQEI